MANYWIWSSVAAFSAIAAQQTSFLSRLTRLFKPTHAAAPPVVETEEGWTLIRCDDDEAFQNWLGADEGLPFHPGEEPSLGSHLLIEMYGCDEEALRQERSVAAAMHEAAVKSNATVVAESFHEFKPWGVSGAVIIQESHYTVHTWPEHGYAAVDLFFCGGTVQVHEAVEVLQQKFCPSRIKFLVVRRGLRCEVER